MAELPQPIQREAERAAAIEAQLMGQGQPTPPVSADPGIPPAAAGQTPAAVQPDQPPVPAEPKQVSQPQGESAEVWQRRYQSLKGKYDAEVPQLHSQLRAQGEQLQALSSKLQELEKGTTKTDPETPVVTKEDETAFGADLIDLIRRISTGEVQRAGRDILSRIETKLAEIDGKVGTVSQTQAVTAEQQFWSDLTRAVPDWQPINDDPAFHEWLKGVNPLAGATYQQLLTFAQQRLSVPQVKAIFDAFKQATGMAPQGNAEPAPSAQAPSQADQTRQELESLAAPSTSRGASTPASGAEDKRIWSGKEYAAAYDPRLARSKSEQEVAALRAAADKAVAEGRVRW